MEVASYSRVPNLEDEIGELQAVADGAGGCQHMSREPFHRPSGRRQPRPARPPGASRHGGEGNGNLRPGRRILRLFDVVIENLWALLEEEAPAESEHDGKGWK